MISLFFRRGIGLLFFAIVPFLASGQEIVFAPSSKSKVLQDIHGDEVMVREMFGSRPVVHVRDANQLNRHYFLMNKSGTDQVVGFHFDLQIPDLDCVKLSIYDMQVYGDSCYVCGEALIDQGVQDGSVLEPRQYSYGFVGRMGMADTVGGAWRVDYMFVYEVERLLQMDVFHPDEGYSGFKLLIVATGEMDDATKPSCLVEIKERADQGWEYSVMQTKKTGEVFTDVLARGNDLFVSSHVDCGEDPDDVEHWFHYVHHTWGKGFRDEYLLSGVLWEDAVKVDNRNLSPTPGGWGWHRSATTMRMCLLDDGKFCLSYAVENRATGEKGVIFYPLRDSYMWYPAVLFYDCCQSDVSDIVYSSLSDMMSVLIHGNIYGLGVVLSNRWSSPTLGVAVQLSGFQMESLNSCGGRSFYLGGYQTGDQKVKVMTQQVMALWPNYNFCFSLRQSSGATMLTNPKVEKQNFEWFEKSHRETTWYSLAGTVGEVDYTVPCFYPWSSEAESLWE